MSKTVKKNSAAEKRAIPKARGEFHTARSEAMNAYAGLEQNMSMLFASLLGTDHPRAFAAFEAVIDSRAKWVMLEKLLTLNHGDKYKKFFNGLMREAGRLNRSRNKIVHWIVYITRRGEEPFDPSQDIFLGEHPDLFGKGQMFLGEINDFKHKTEFYATLIMSFNLFLMAPDLRSDPEKTRWHEIFLSEPVYPPPLGHPLDRFH